jgi:hypothetical protein
MRSGPKFRQITEITNASFCSEYKKNYTVKHFIKNYTVKQVD